MEVGSASGGRRVSSGYLDGLLKYELKQTEAGSHHTAFRSFTCSQHTTHHQMHGENGAWMMENITKNKDIDVGKEGGELFTESLHGMSVIKSTTERETCIGLTSNSLLS